MSSAPPQHPAEVALVDCYATGRVFISDAAFDALAANLADRGYPAERIEIIRDDAPAGSGFDDACRKLNALAPRRVVITRAWDETVPQRLRQAAGGDCELIRLSHGAPSAIDAHFDQVLDAQGVLALLAGSTDVTAPHWRSSKSDLTTPASTSVTQSGAWPSISGPARGCPFLADVRQSPAYADSDIDFESVQTKGCSFCLDNVGAYAAHPEADVVDTWMAQLRSLRQQQPDSREVLLTDERPHPYLPELFRRIAGQPELHGVDLLIKSRVDWLEEYADSALREACDLAEQSGSVVHVYLVGFESFHQADLDLFNKAVTVADNVRAIDTLRRLELRHPRSFEYRRHRAHGVVLFHPWTTIESLLDNARIMRDVQFHELRSQALRTRLRLYASVPLHALAERQGLLTDAFATGRTDRATEQGYDASVPWHFADARIEAIFQGCDRLSHELTDLRDCDLLELVTRFVARWPAFAEHPDLAALPLRQALLSWGTSVADIIAIAGCAVAGSDREVEAVARGEKPACLKEGIEADDAAALVRAYEVMGLSAAIVSQHRRGGDDGAHAAGTTHAIVAVASDGDTLGRVLDRQSAVEAGDADAIADMGQLMGYPTCCVAAFKEQPDHGANQRLEHTALCAHPERPLAPLINRVGAVSLTPHFPCTPDCAASETQSETRLAAMAVLDEEAAERVRAHLHSPVLRLDYRRAALVEGGWDGDRYIVRTAHPIAFPDFPRGAVRALRFDGDGAVLETADGEERRLAAPAILVEPGSPLAPQVRRSIAAAPRDEPAEVAETQPSADLESIHRSLAVGRHVADFEILASARDAARVTVTLGNNGERIELVIAPWHPDRPALSRRGGWALDLSEDRPPTATEQKVVGAIARLLPAGSRGSGDSQPPREARRAAPTPSKQTQVDGVLCTAPWTTLEIVEPDGRARQCCADWTEGDRGNLHESTLADIWNGAGYRAARRIMAGTDLRPLCREICPRLYDHKFAEKNLTLIPGAAAFVANQEVLFADIEQRRETTRAKPLYIAVCPSTYCNYDCIMCLHGRTPRRDLSETIWEELAEMLPTVHVLTLLGGEPLANPAAMGFLRSWNREQYPDASVAIVSNGSLLGPAVLSQLERCNFGNVTISLNAGTAEVYERVQRGVELDAVLANIDALIELRRRQGANFPIVLSFVVQPANHQTLIDFAELARQRALPIRLMPLSPEGVEELDFYDDTEQVEQVLASLDAMRAWAERAAPDYLNEILGTRSAIAKKAAAPHGGRSNLRIE